jgi:pyrimidine deaminase RibD-like protein
MMPDYDSYLGLVVQHLRERWLDPNVGIVAAGIFDPAREPVLATSLDTGAGRWLHAERNALSQYSRQYGEPGRGAIVVCTLSPCVRILAASRVGESCSRLLVEHGMLRVHVGTIDEYQLVDCAGYYEDAGIKITLAEDVNLRATCENLKSMFGKYDQYINSGLPGIKKEIGFSLFR